MLFQPGRLQLDKLNFQQLVMFMPAYFPQVKCSIPFLTHAVGTQSMIRAATQGPPAIAPQNFTSTLFGILFDLQPDKL